MSRGHLPAATGAQRQPGPLASVSHHSRALFLNVSLRLGRVNCRFEIGRIRPTEICQIRRSESPDRESAETRAGSPPAVRVWRRLRNPLLDPWWLSAPSGGLRRLLEPTFAPPSRGVYRRVSSPRNPRVELLSCTSRSATRGHCTSPRRREGYT